LVQPGVLLEIGMTLSNGAGVGESDASIHSTDARGLQITRVGYLVPEFPSQTHAFFWREINTLRSLGTEVYPLSTRKPPPDACRHAFAAEAAAQTHYGFPPRLASAIASVLTRPRSLLRCLGYITSLSEASPGRRLRLLGMVLVAGDLLSYTRAKRIQHLHVHSCGDAAHLAALCRLLGGPSYSLVLHGDLSIYGVDHGAKMRDASFVVCVTRPLKSQVVEKLGLDSRRCTVLWMGVDTASFTDANKRQPSPGRLRIITVARLNVTKGHAHALAAVRRLVDRGIDVHYVIAGEGPHRSAIALEVERLGLQASVEITGTLSEAEVLSSLQAADVLVLPSFGLGEAAPVAVMEGMACGLPVVCSLIGGTGDMIEDGVDGFLVPQQDEAELADRLYRLAQDIRLRHQMGQAARRKAVAMFDTRALGHRLQNLMNSA
jgi:colanic acid/amylovoran biosynthesis glycosyltransferase